MARPRKNATKAQGSLLKPDEVAEIPVEEQPYPLPEGWKWERGNSLWKPQETEKPTGEFFYYIDIDAVDNKQQKVISPKKIPLSQAPSRASRKLHEGDTIFSLVRPYLRNIAYIDEDISSCIASTGFYICSPLKSVNSRFLYWLMTSDYVVLGLNKFMKGDNSPSIRKNDIENFPFPLPPIDEQQRIVDRIESLFAKLDEAKAKAETVLDGFEIRKAALLHKVFTGALTAKWREEKNISLKSWDSCPLISVLKEKPRNGYSPKPVEYTTNVKSMTLSATTSGFFRPEFFKYIDEEIPENSHLWLSQGDILIQRANSLEKVGTNAIYTGGEHEFIYPDLIMKLQVKAPHSYKYIAYILSTQATLNYFRTNATGTAGNMPKINQQIVSNTPIVVPSSEEQQEIVRILDSLLAKEQHVKEAAENVLNQIELMKKAILAKAFRGELGTHVPAINNPQYN